MVDGAVARKTNTVSEFGSKLDTAADFLFAVVCLIKLIPVIPVPTWLILWIVVIAVIKAVNLVSGYIMRKEIVVLHTAMNKVTGILLFVFLLTCPFIDLKYSGAIVCAAATFAAIQEGHLIRNTMMQHASGSWMPLTENMKSFLSTFHIAAANTMS